MPHQSDPTPRQISPVACIHGMIAATAATCLAAIIYAEAITVFEAYRGVPALLAAVIAVTGIGAFIRNAQDRVNHRQEQLDRQRAEQVEAAENRVVALIERLDKRMDDRRQEDYASAFVAGASGGRHLQPVRQG